MRFSCLIDTCSCIYLGQAEFQQKTLLKYLYDITKLIYSNEVSLEIRDHKKEGIPDFIDNTRLRLGPRKMSISMYEKKMLGKTLPSRKKGGNKGELNNLIIALDQIHHLKLNTSIFITDDKNAINGLLSGWLAAYPSIRLWTSFEVLLFLYAESIIPSIDIAYDLLQQLISIKAPPPNERSQKTTQELINIKASYSKRLQTIHQLLN